MTRRDYVRTAAIIREIWPPNKPQNRPPRVSKLANMMADMMAEDNPAFVRDRFLAASGEKPC